jgi:hypothetical protein
MTDMKVGDDVVLVGYAEPRTVMTIVSLDSGDKDYTVRVRYPNGECANYAPDDLEIKIDHDKKMMGDLLVAEVHFLRAMKWVPIFAQGVPSGPVFWKDPISGEVRAQHVAIVAAKAQYVQAYERG